ncbi:MAG: peptide chain release factor N(5)-glutamine methyltransferase [Holophagaceae bacterium]
MDWDHLHRHLLQTLKELTSAEEAHSELRLWIEDGFGHDLAWLTLHGQDRVDEPTQRQLKTWIERRKKGEPCQYLWGHTRFRGRFFHCDPRVLIPRPETELVIEEALARRSAREPLQVWDVGTGSGIIGVTLALETDWMITASDLSAEALSCAKENALHHQAPLKFVQSDLLQACRGSLDLVIANLPYLSPSVRDHLQPELHFEPSQALFADEAGYALMKRLLQEGWQRQVPLMIFEIGHDQAPPLTLLAEQMGWPQVRTTRDWNGFDRVLVVEKP